MDYLIIGLIGIVYLALYYETFFYVHNWDDTRHLTGNPYFREISISSLLEFWKRPYFGMYIPLSYNLWGFILWVTRDLFEFSFLEIITSLRILNCSIHFINFLLLINLIDKTRVGRKWAILCSSLFLFHPTTSELILWVSEFRGLLSGMLALIGLNLYFHKGSSKSLSWPILIASTFAKPSSVIVFIGIFVYQFYKKHPLKNWIEIIISIIVSTIPAFILLGEQVKEGYNVENVWITKACVVSYSYVMNFLLLVFPSDIKTIYPTNIYNADQISIYVIISFLVLIFTSLLVLNFSKKWSCVMAIIFITLLPNSGVISFSYQEYSLIANRYLYFGAMCIPLCLSISLGRITRFHFIFYLFIVGFYLSSILEFAPNWKSEHHLWDQAYIQNSKNEKIKQNWILSHYDPLVIAYLYRNQGYAELFSKLKHRKTAFDKDAVDKRSRDLISEYSTMFQSGQFGEINEDFQPELVLNHVYSSQFHGMMLLSQVIEGQHDEVKLLYQYYVERFQFIPKEQLKIMIKILEERKFTELAYVSKMRLFIQGGYVGIEPKLNGTPSMVLQME